MIEPAPTRDHTERALAAFGATWTWTACTVAIEGGQRLHARAICRCRATSRRAMFWLVLAAGHARVRRSTSRVSASTRRARDAARRCSGARAASRSTAASGAAGEGGEPMGRIRLRGGASAASGRTGAGAGHHRRDSGARGARGDEPRRTDDRARRARELRVKESDRIAMLARGFRAIGRRDRGVPRWLHHPCAAASTAASSTPAGIIGWRWRSPIAGDAPPPPGVDSRAPIAVDVSYPGFFTRLERLSQAGDDR